MNVKKYFLGLGLLAGILLATPALSQNFGETSEHKRLWKKFGRKKHRDAFNPNVDSRTNKATHEQSRKQARQDKKDLKKSQKEAMRQYRKNKRKVKSGK